MEDVLKDDKSEIEETSEKVSEDSEEPSNIKFVCPSCGEIERDDVVFLCNTCDRSELIFMEGIYMCPSCLKPGKNFQCMKCDSKTVEMHKKDE